MTTTTDRGAAQLAEYEALTSDHHNRLWDGGDVRGVPIRCDYCGEPAAFASAVPPKLRVACDHAVHIAWALSTGSAVPVSEITAGQQRELPDGRITGYPVDPATVVPPAPCGCPVYADSEDATAVVHEHPCPEAPAPVCDGGRSQKPAS